MLLNIDFRAAGNSDDYLLDGWAEQEETHRWSMGRQSRLRIPRSALGAGDVLVICATPCLHPPGLVGQSVMVAVDDRLLGTMVLRELHVVGLRLPAGLEGDGDAVLSFLHLSQGIARPRAQIRRRQRLALMMHSVRIFRIGLRGEAMRPAGRLVPRELAQAFESIGQACQFGLVQRHFGAEPVGLLRFVDITTAALYEALVARFAGVDAPDALRLSPTAEVRPTYRWDQTRYDLRFDTRCFVDETDATVLHRQQVARLIFLRRKFLEDVAAAEKIFVLTRSDCLTEAEALAVFCALRELGACTLLWASYGDASRAGEVMRVFPGFLRAELGEVDEDRYGSFGVWLEVMEKAVLF